MGKIVAIANQKGGVGKTTTSINLAAALTTLDRRVLLVDLDPQGNATMGSGIDKNNLNASINELLLAEHDSPQVLLATQYGFDILPANRDLTHAEIQLLQLSRKEYRLRQCLSPLKGSYDYIVIDCPPTLNMLTVNGLVAADGVIIPMQCEYYALEGLSGLLETVEQIRKTVNPTLTLLGIIRTMYDPRNCLTNDVSAQLLEHFPEQVFKTTIPRNVRLAEAPSFGQPVMFYDRRSAGAEAYMQMAKELIEGIQQQIAPSLELAEE